MFCSQCGKKSNNCDKFCSSCGLKLDIPDKNYKSSHPNDGRFFSVQFMRDLNDYLIQSDTYKKMQDVMERQLCIEPIPAIIVLELSEDVQYRDVIEKTKILDTIYPSEWQSDNPLWYQLLQKFNSIKVRPKYNREELIAYLSSELFYGVGPKLATQIVDELGLKAIGLILANPEKLTTLMYNVRKIKEFHSALFEHNSDLNIMGYVIHSLFVVDIERTQSKITKVWFSIVKLEPEHRLRFSSYLRKNYDMPLTTKVAGVTFEGRQKTISEIYFKFDKLTMNPDNEFNGIQLFHKAPYGKNEYQSMELGFIPKEQVNEVKYLMNYFDLECLLVDVTGGGGDFNYGVKIMIYIREFEAEAYELLGYTGWENTDTITDGVQVTKSEWDISVYDNNMRELVSSKLNGPTYISNN